MTRQTSQPAILRFALAACRGRHSTTCTPEIEGLDTNNWWLGERSYFIWMMAIFVVSFVKFRRWPSPNECLVILSQPGLHGLTALGRKLTPHHEQYAPWSNVSAGKQLKLKINTRVTSFFVVWTTNKPNSLRVDSPFWDDQMTHFSLHLPSAVEHLFPPHFWRESQKSLPSRELTYPPKKWHFEDDFPFPKVGYVNSLGGYPLIGPFSKRKTAGVVRTSRGGRHPSGCSGCGSSGRKGIGAEGALWQGEFFFLEGGGKKAGRG